MKKYTAVYGKRGNNRIVSVRAENEDEARKEIARQLSKNPSRLEMLQAWREFGEQVIVRQ